jgi:hypothetical protein
MRISRGISSLTSNADAEGPSVLSSPVYNPGQKPLPRGPINNFSNRDFEKTPGDAMALSRVRATVLRAVPANAPISLLAWLAASFFTALTVTCSAGPCLPEIAAVQARLDARLAAAEAGAPSAPESSAALRHQQPTPHSIADTLLALGKISPEKAKIIRERMAWARQADQAGNRTACQQALEDVERAIRR